MTMGDVYEEMKAALKFFGLAFSKMHEVEFTVKDGTVIFSHDGRTVSFDPSNPGFL